MPVSQWIETVSNAITDGKIAEVLRSEIGLLERQLADASLRADKAEARILVLEDENKKLHGELADFRKAARQKDDSHKLSDQAVSVLQWISKHGQRGSYELQRSLGLETAKCDYLISILTRRVLIDYNSAHPAEGTFYHCTHSGLDYLAANDLL